MSATLALIHWEEVIVAALSKVEVSAFDGELAYDEREVADEIERALDRLGFEIVRKERSL